MKTNVKGIAAATTAQFRGTTPCHKSRGLAREVGGAILVMFFVLCCYVSPVQAQVAKSANIVGEIERLTIDSPKDPWSGGVIVVGGQNIIIPRNLLMDLPANRLTLTQVFAQAPSACLSRAESGLAKADVCNTSKVGGIATIQANRTSNGNVIAGDIFLQKGVETVKGVVTFINYADGFFRINGTTTAPTNATTGVMVRLNDPLKRHTVQQGSGCVVGSTVNCSPDPRFTLDRDNYTNTFSTGVPSCLPSTTARTFVDTLDVNANGNTAESLTTQSTTTGTGDLLCPSTNRTPDLIVADSRRFAPIQVGDSIEAEGNFETVNGVKFVSAHTTGVLRALGTRNVAGQPDYLTLDEVGMDVPGFQNQRVRTLFIGFASLNTDVMIWSLHYDPTENRQHEFPLASVVGCDNAAGAGTCGQNGLVGGVGGNIWKIRHDVDFIAPATLPRLDPCAHLRGDPRFITSNPCPLGGTFEEQFGILSPIPHEIMTRTGRKFADAAGALKTIDITGAASTNGEYLFPLGMGLGGIVNPEFVEIDLNAIDTPTSFTGIPWNLDRRLSPGGCENNLCEPTLQPLSPFPYEGFDPRTQAGVPTGAYNDPNFTASTLSNASNRILSYVSLKLDNFDGNNTVLPWPPVNPAALPITPTNIYTPPTVCDVTPPTAPTALTATAVSPTTINLSWTASTDNIGVTSYKVFRDGAPSPIASVVGTTFSDTGLPASSTHTYTVMASDAVGNLSPASNTASATTPADTAPPTAPTLSATAPNSTTVNLSWTASTDNVGVTGYRVFRDGGATAIAIVSGTSFSDIGLAVGSTHTYNVKAADAAGNQSLASNTVTITTQGADVTPPSVPTGVTATGASATVIDIAWAASTDNIGVTGYKVFRDGVAAEIATVSTGTSFSDTGLAVGSTHSYTVSAFDAANNQSAKSASASATTQVTGALVSLTLNPTTVTAPAPSTGTVTLSGAAPAGGLSISLTSSNTGKATVPPTVLVPAGATTATFTVTSRTGQLGGGSNPVTITATLAGTGRSAVLNILR